MRFAPGLKTSQVRASDWETGRIRLTLRMGSSAPLADPRPRLVEVRSGVDPGGPSFSKRLGGSDNSWVEKRVPRSVFVEAVGVVAKARGIPSLRVAGSEERRSGINVLANNPAGPRNFQQMTVPLQLSLGILAYISGSS